MGSLAFASNSSRRRGRSPRCSLPSYRRDRPRRSGLLRDLSYAPTVSLMPTPPEWQDELLSQLDDLLTRMKRASAEIDERLDAVEEQIAALDHATA